MNLETLNSLLSILAIIPLIANIVLLVQVTKLKKRVTESHQQTRRLITYFRKQNSRKAFLKNKQALIEKSVNSSTVAVENIHQSISAAAFNAINNLSSTDKSKSRNKKLKDLHDQTSHDVYKSVKVVNKQLGAITETLLSTRKPARTTHSDKQSTSVQAINAKKPKRLPPKR